MSELPIITFCKKSKFKSLNQCLIENNRFITIIGTSCTGKSTLLSRLDPNIYVKSQIGGRDEDQYVNPKKAMTTSIIFDNIVNKKITDIILIERKVDEILKCQLNERYHPQSTLEEDMKGLSGKELEGFKKLIKDFDLKDPVNNPPTLKIIENEQKRLRKIFNNFKGGKVII